MTDPFEPSDEWRARMDQMRAGAREFTETMRAFVEQLVADGWTEQQARELVIASIRAAR